MADSEQVLTQEQIDAMLAGTSLDNTAPAEAGVENTVTVAPTTIDEVRAQEAAVPAPPPAPPAAPPPPAAASGVDAGALQGAVDQLSQRLSQMEAAAGQTEQLRAELQAWAGQLQTLTATVESLLTSVQGTVGYGAHESFVCRSCQSHGNVAAKLNCTACGEENWWGWWPPQQ